MDIQTLKIEHDKVSGRKVVNSRFRLLQNIGQGQFGKVLLAQDLSCTKKQQYVAIKTINRVDTARLITKTYLSHTTKIKREIQIMKECAHPNVVKLLQVIDDMKYDKILLVLEYCALGEIDWKKYNHYHEKYLKDASKRLCLNRVLRDVANGLEYLHSYKNIIHRDLKPSNLLISSDRTIKISDFGVSLILENNANDDKELGKTMGTPAFFAPELCQFVNNRLSSFNEIDLMRSKVDARIDIWSLGVTLYCLFFHQLPFEGVNEFDLFKNIVNNELRFPTTRRSSMAKPDDVTELALLEDLIRGLLAKKPQKRPTLAQIKHHGFTTFDISGSEIETFTNFNRSLALDKVPMFSDGENKVTQRLRKLFISRSDHSLPTDSDTTANSDPQTLITRVGLESVDDLLDSYLDDSSSFESVDDDDTEPVLLATKDFFASSKAPENSSRNAEADWQKLNPGNTASLKNAPVPLNLSTSNFDLSKPKVSPFVQNANGVRTPTSAHPIVTIGPDSPSSASSVFSPSRRFFLRFKKRSPDPTISTLSGNMADSIHMKLTPPPLFGGKSTQSCRNSMTSIDSGGVSSRKNSISSNTSGTFSRISSSSSSLNLHAYLVGSPDVSPKETYYTKAPRREKHESESSSGDADITISMDQFLDQLES